jgi:hypothetical protein
MTNKEAMDSPDKTKWEQGVGTGSGSTADDNLSGV